MSILIQNALVVNENEVFEANLFLKDGLIYNIDSIQKNRLADHKIQANGNLLIPGAIDDQVHFREPGLTHKANIYTEARAAIAGGITSFMEMPNTKPGATYLELLEQKYEIAKANSLANYSFYMGTTNDNLEELKKVNPKNVCGVKIFMGSSTGNMLVDDGNTLENIFSQIEMLIAVHCESDEMIKENLEKYQKKFGENIPVKFHPKIRSAEACYASSSFAVDLAKKNGTRLHILHISTEKELDLFDNSIPLNQKKITAEACVHHLWFEQNDYENKQTLIKWNPAVKTKKDRSSIQKAVLDNRIDVIATDHAPHTFEEKQNPYTKAPSGAPLVQHALPALFELHHQRVFSLEKIVEKFCHNPAILFQIEKRGFIREGYFADLVLANLNEPWQVQKENILYKCGWSPFEGQTFKSKIKQTIVNGNLIYNNGVFNEAKKGKRLTFDR